MRLVSELRRRNVFRMAVLYVVAAWLIMQVAEVLISLAALPEWTGRVLLLLLAVGFPIALIFSWFYELTPEGISLEKDVEHAESITHVTGRRMDFIVISLLAAAVILFAYDKWWISGPSERTIAVLAFENMSDDPDQEYFSDGIAEELLNALAKIPELRVTSRSSAFSFKGMDADIPTIAAQLNVAHVLEGSVRRVGDRVRVTAQLIDAESDSHLWSESYDRDVEDIFAVQDDIANAISDELKVKLVLDSGEAAAPKVAQSASVAAYDAYLQARELINDREAEDLWRARQHLERALRLDADFAPAHAQLAIAILITSDNLDVAQWEFDRKSAMKHLDRAQELEPDLADAHAGRALLALKADDPESVIEHAEKALAVNPSYIDPMNWLHFAYRGVGKYRESDAVLERMLIVDPLTVFREHYVRVLGKTGRWVEARAMADRMLEQRPCGGCFIHAELSQKYEGTIADSLYWGLLLGRESHNYGWVWSSFMYVGEFDEARRLWPGVETIIAGAEGRWDEVIAELESIMQTYPLLDQLPLDVAHAYYQARRFEEALVYYRRFFDEVRDGRIYETAVARGPIFETTPIIGLMRKAHAHRRTGDEAAAQATADIAREAQATLRAAGRDNNNRDLADAMIAAFDGQSEGAIAALSSAVNNGLRSDGLVRDDPIFDKVRDEPGFVAVRDELEAIVAREHRKVLQLVCFNNPTPEHWRPLPETCDGVVEYLDVHAQTST